MGVVAVVDTSGLSRVEADKEDRDDDEEDIDDVETGAKPVTVGKTARAAVTRRKVRLEVILVGMMSGRFRLLCANETVAGSTATRDDWENRSESSTR